MKLLWKDEKIHKKNVKILYQGSNKLIIVKKVNIFILHKKEKNRFLLYCFNTDEILFVYSLLWQWTLGGLIKKGI